MFSCYIKATSGRGRITASWTANLHDALLLEFDRLCKVGLKFRKSLLQMIATEQIQNATEQQYKPLTIQEKSERPYDEVITVHWIQNFMEKHAVVLRGVSGKFLVSPENLDLIPREVARHLGVLQRALSTNELY